MASVDYDPQKAHEYYEKHKKLKGRRSTKGFSDSQKEQLSYARAQLQEQKKRRDAQDKGTNSAQKKAALEKIEELKQKQKEQLTNAANQKIEQMRDRLKNMSPEMKKLAKERINSTISGIREKLSETKKSITEKSNAEKKNARQQYSSQLKDARAKSKETYEKDLDSAYDKIKSSGSKSKSKSKKKKK